MSYTYEIHSSVEIDCASHRKSSQKNTANGFVVKKPLHTAVAFLQCISVVSMF